MNKKISSYMLGGLMALVIAIPVLFIGPDANATLYAGDLVATKISLLRSLVGFLGIVTLIIILFGGLKWLIFRKNESKVKKAKKLIVFGLISLVVVILTYVSGIFVFVKLPPGA